MNIISFCLFGENPKYNIGAIRNADLAKEIYPEWKCFYFISSLAPIKTIVELKKRENVRVIIEHEYPGWQHQQNRYKALDEPKANYVIFRDVDSRLNYREKACVDEWIKSGKSGHIMKDHPCHQATILGGMFGIKGGVIPSITKLIGDYKNNRNQYHNDYEFLHSVIYPYIKDSVLIHDEIHNINNFPTKRGIGKELFVGQIFDENDNQVKEHIDILEKWLYNEGKDLVQ